MSEIFIKVPAKIFDLNLDCYDIAVFLVLLKHGKNIFPGTKRICALAGGISKKRLQISKNNLRKCNMILWDKGLGKSNVYTVLGEGCWTKKHVEKHVDNFLDRTPREPSSGLLGSLSVGRQGVPNYIKLNRTIELGGKGFSNLVDKLKEKREK